jgi:predicted phage tail protein
LAISEGEIQGIDDVLLNSISYTNYPSVTMDWRPGTISQTAIPGFSDVESPLSGAGAFPVTTLYNIDHIYSVAGTKSAVRVTLTLGSLKYITGDGDRVGYTVQHSIYVRNHPAGGPGTWVLAKIVIKTGKASNPYSWDTRIDRPSATLSTDSWDIRIVRNTQDDSTLGDHYISPSQIQALISIVDSPLTYPYTALLALTFTDASIFNNQVPLLRILPKGIKFQLPSNYNATTRVYTGTWDTFFKSFTEYTNNLSWVIYNCLINTRWGLAIPASDVDVGSFYLFAQYCDGLLNDGQGGNIYRYTIDIQFIERDNVPTFLMYLLNLGNANFSDNSFGQVSIIWDHPSQAVTRLFSNANVIDAEFSYSSNSLDSRINLVNVTYSDRLLLGDTNTATYSEDSLITRYGLQTSDIVLAGCTNKAQALYKAKWAVWVNSYDTEIIHFKLLFAGASIHVGELISIMDSDNIDTISHHAVIVSSVQVTTTTQITLDRAIILANVAYTIQCVLSDGVTISALPIAETNGTFSVVTVNSLIVPFVGSTILFSTATVTPRTAKVTKIDKTDNIYSITCVNHTEAKYAYYETPTTITLPSSTGSFVNVTNFTVPAVTGIAVTQVFASDGINSSSRLTVTWDWDTAFTQKFRALFKVSWNRDNLDYHINADLPISSFDIENPVPGAYSFNVWALNPLTGLSSVATTYTYNYRIAPATSTLNAPINLQISGTSPGTGTFATKDCTLYWENPTTNLSTTDKLNDYIVEIHDYTTLALIATYIVIPDSSQHGNFIFTFLQNTTVFTTPTRQFRVRVFCRDLLGDLSAYSELVCNNPVPSVQSFTMFAGTSSAYLKLTTASPESDITGFKVWRKAGSTWTTITDAGVSEVYDGPDTYISLSVPDTQTYYYKIAAYDDFGKTGLTLSGAISSTALSLSPPAWTMTGIVFTISAANTIAWTSGSIYKDGTLSGSIVSGSSVWSTGTLYVYYNPAVSTTVLQVTTTLGTAVASGNYPLATYTGGAVTNIKGGDGSAFISGSQLIAETVGASQLVSGSAVITGTAQIQDAIINSAKIIDGNITNAKIDRATANKLQVVTADITDLTVTAAKIANLNVTSGKIADLAVTTGKIANLAVDTLKIADHAVTVVMTAIRSALAYSDSSISIVTGVLSTTNSVELVILMGATIYPDGNALGVTIQLTSNAGTYYNVTHYSGTISSGISISVPANTSYTVTLYALTGNNGSQSGLLYLIGFVLLK